MPPPDRRGRHEDPMSGQTIDLAALPPGRALRVRRVAAGLTQQELAERVGAVPSRVSDAERDQAREWPHVKALRERLMHELEQPA